MTTSAPHRLTLARSAAAGFVLLDAALVQGRAAPVDIRIVTSAPVSGTADAYAHGRERLAAGDIGAALSAFRQALAADPQSVGALNGIAVCYDRLGQYDISRSYYALALAIEPQSPTVLNNFGYSLYLQGDNAGAMAPLRTAAASSDAEAAATARRTLALIAATPAPAAPYPGDDPNGPRIVQTSDGEQRLITRPAAIPAALASLGPDAALAAAPSAWTDRDDARLTAEERHDEVVASMTAALAAPHTVVTAAPDFTTVALAATPDRNRPAMRLDTATRLDRLLPPGVREADGDGPASHWLAALPGGSDPRGPARRPATGLAPGVPERTGFDSDDAALNRFAALMQGDEAALRIAAIERLQRLRERLAVA